MTQGNQIKVKVPASIFLTRSLRCLLPTGGFDPWWSQRAEPTPCAGALTQAQGRQGRQGRLGSPTHGDPVLQKPAGTQL